MLWLRPSCVIWRDESHVRDGPFKDYMLCKELAAAYEVIHESVLSAA